MQNLSMQLVVEKSGQLIDQASPYMRTVYRERLNAMNLVPLNEANCTRFYVDIRSIDSCKLWIVYKK